MIDKFLALAALAILIGFTGILVGFVPELDLTIVVVVSVALGVYDFYLAAFRNRSNGR